MALIYTKNKFVTKNLTIFYIEKSRLLKIYFQAGTFLNFMSDSNQNCCHDIQNTIYRT